MKTIKTDIAYLMQVIGQAYSEKPKKEIAKGNVEIQFDDFWKIEDKEIMLYSMISHITLSDASFYPILRSNYGVPAGLISIHESTKKKKDNYKSKNIEDYQFVMYRRALLYASAWFIKSIDEFEIIKDCINSLSNSKGTFMRCLLTKLSESNYYPEENTKNDSLSDTHYDFAGLWFGRQLAIYYFPETKKMDDIHKKWYIELRDGKLKKDAEVPPLYKPDFSDIVSYIIVLKANEEENFEIQNLIRLAEKISSNKKTVHEIVYRALIYIGLYKSNASYYYYASKANPMMVIMEKLAYIISQKITSDFTSDMEGAVNSLQNVDPKETCVTYYKIKNPGIENRKWFDFDKTEKLGSEDEIALLTSKNAEKFIKLSERETDIPNLFKNGILVTEESKGSDDVSKYNFNYITIKKNGKFDICIKDYSLDNKQTYITLTENKDVLKLPFASKVVRPIKEGKVWIIQLTSRSGLTSLAGKILSEAYKYAKPEAIMVIYHLDGVSNSIDPDYSLIIANLQRTFNNMFSQSITSIIRYDPAVEIWEAVARGEKVLEKYDYKDIQVIEMRQDKFVNEPKDFILRMIRNVIIYDESMKYMFMNLNS